MPASPTPWSDPSADPRRRLLLEIYASACQAVDGRRRMRAALAGEDPGGDWWLLAIGKAASAMTLGAIDAWGPRIARGLVITRDDHWADELRADRRFTCMPGDHPVPGERSLAAGAAALEFAAGVPPGQRVLVLVSGGASSLVEVPVAGVTPDDLRALNAWGLAAGLDIIALNALRRRVSRIKGGRLAAALAHAQARACALSDVPGDDPAVIGSGLIAATHEEPVLPALPPWVDALLARGASLDPGATLPCRLVGSLDDALAAAERSAAAQGFTTRRLPGRLSGDVLKGAARFAHEFAFTQEDVLIWGGEPTVQLPTQPGRGGRNQHLALAAARLIAGHPEIILLAAGTDGSDGNSDDAGAIVDGATLARGAEAGLSADQALARADSGTYLEATGDLLYTGPTGTNVGDLLVALRRAPPAVAGPVDQTDDGGAEPAPDEPSR